MKSWRDIRPKVAVQVKHLSVTSVLTTLALAILSSFMASTLALAGDLDKVLLFNIQAESLDKALLQFGAQAHVQIGLAWNVSAARVRKYQLRGRYTGKEALERLLKGSHLSYVVQQGHNIEVLPQVSPDRNVRDSKLRDAQRNGGARPSNRPTSQNIDPAVEGPQSLSDHAVSSLDEVIVTAQKYRQSALEVPISLDVITAEQLQRQAITTLNDLQYAVPGLYVEGGNKSQYVVLRGVSNISGNGALVGEYIDEADISADGYAGEFGFGTGDVQLYDLSRVEVLKGPQGTLYGDGAMGGVIRYITNKPLLNSYDMSADASALFTQYGAPSQRIEAMINAPLVANALGVRIAGQFQHEGGWVDEPAAQLKNINDLNLSDVRIEAMWQLTPVVKALATQVIHREAYGFGSGEDAQGDITQVYGVTSPPTGEQRLNLTNLTISADLGVVEMVSSSSYLNHSETTYNQSFVLPSEVSLDSYLPLSNETYNQELRFHSMSSGPWQWTLGGFYKHYRDHDAGSEYFGKPGPISTASYYVTSDSDQSTSEAVFADTNVRVLSRLSIGAGVRYFKSRFTVIGQGAYFNGKLFSLPSTAQEHFQSTDPRVYAQYHIAEGANIYASAAKGFRSGEPNLGLFEGFRPESLWSYDLGTKLRLWRGRVSTNVDAFMENYADYVGFGLVSVNGIPFFGNFNVGNARIRGLDADISWVISGWRFSTKGEIVGSKFVSISVKDTGFSVGERLPLVPSYTFTAAVQREFELKSLPGSAEVYYSETGRVRGSSSSPVAESDVIHLLNFRAGVRVNRTVSLAFFAHNLLNDRGYLDPYWYEAAAYRSRPRTFGFDLSVTLE